MRKKPELEQTPSEITFETSAPTSLTEAVIPAPPMMGQCEENVPKTLKEYLHLTRTATPSCIMFPPNVPQSELKLGRIQLLPIFHGLENEKPYVHVREFEDVVATLHSCAEATDIVRLKFFLFSLRDKAKSWLYSLRPRSIGSWDEMTNAFFNKYFPHHKANSLK